LTQTLHTLLEHAERQRDEALAALLRAEDTLRRLELQAGQLQAYRGEYDDRGPARSGRPSPIELLHCHRDFMLRLDQAVLQQQGQLQGAAARLAQLRATLLARETRLAAVRKLIERRTQEQRLAAARLEQRRSDDAVPRGPWRLGTDALPAIR
jgi:flagellar protein FliJ